jgi:predicted alpha/beta-fold hydrolase
VYHAGRSDDVRRVVEWAARRAPGSPIALVGFSLGANLVLKLAAEAAVAPIDGFDCVLAANPPIDLALCARTIRRPGNRIYDRNFTRSLRAEASRLHAAFPDLGPVSFPKAMTVYDFDQWYTAPRNGFRGADDYYERSSAARFIPGVGHAGLVVHSEDDPFIPSEPFRRVTFPPRLALELIPGGGHLGYLSQHRWGGDRRWLDGRLTTWLAARWSLTEAGNENAPSGAGRPDPEENPSVERRVACPKEVRTHAPTALQ